MLSALEHFWAERCAAVTETDAGKTSHTPLKAPHPPVEERRPILTNPTQIVHQLLFQKKRRINVTRNSNNLQSIQLSRIWRDIFGKNDRNRQAISKEMVLLYATVTLGFSGSWHYKPQRQSGAFIQANHSDSDADTLPSHASGIRSIITRDLVSQRRSRKPWAQPAHPSIQPAHPTVQLAQAWRLSGPYSVLFHLGSQDKQLSNVISSNWNDDINYDAARSCYWPEPSLVALTAWSCDGWAAGWRAVGLILKKREKNGMNGETMSKRERERGNVFMVSDCRLHPAV